MSRIVFTLPFKLARAAPLGHRTGAARLQLAAAALLSGLALAPLPAQAQYSTLFLPAPAVGQPAGAISPLALNNAGQVLAGNFWGGPAPDRGLVRFSNGITTALTFPVGYHLADIGFLFYLNDLGVAVATGQLDSAAGTNGGKRPIVWDTSGAARALPLPMSPADCGARFNSVPPPYTQELFSVFPMGLNRAGHILASACNSLWIMDADGAILAAGPPPADLPPIGLQPVYFEELLGSHLNDADIASVETGVPGYQEGTHPGILSAGLSSFFPLPMTYGFAGVINNRNQVVAFVQSGSTADCKLWDGSALVELGACAMGSLNNLGQVFFMTSTFNPQFRLYKDGSVQPFTPPPEVVGMTLTASPHGFNDAGQIVGMDQFGRGFLLTPTGSCAADVTPQIRVRRGLQRFDPATQRTTQTVKVRNNGSTTLAAPVSIAIDNLPATATLFNTDGATSCDLPAGSFYFNLVNPVAPGQTAKAKLEFINPSGARLEYNTRVLAGAGRR